MSSKLPAAPNNPQMITLDTTSDNALMVAVGRWREPALAEIYRRHGAGVHNLARRVLGSATLADEVTQEVFLDLWNKPEKFDADRGSLRTFLLTKAHGKSVDLLRSDAARRTREEYSGRETVAAGYDIDHYVWDLALADQVKEALRILPEEERKPIEIAYFEGHTYKEVARILDIPEGTIKSRIRAGLRRLRTSLVQQGVDLPWNSP